MVDRAFGYVGTVFAQRPRVTMPGVLIAAAVMLVGILDVISTNAGLVTGAVEANPLMALTQDVFGSWWFAPKLALHLVAVAIVVLRPARAVYACVGAVVVVNALVVLSNFTLAGAI
jgi:hypothetical protein